MNNTAIMMPSVTYALKARDIFRKSGIKCSVQRLASSSVKGCTHYISVNADTEKAIYILKKNNIKYGEVIPKAVEP